MVRQLQLCSILLIITLQSFSQDLGNWMDSARTIQNSKPDSAYQLANKAYELAEENEDYQKQAEILLLKGDILYNQGAFASALEYYLFAQKYFQENEDELGVANVKLKVGRIKYYIKQEQTALDELQQALAVFQKHQLDTRIAETYGEIGHLYEKGGELDSAYFYQKQALLIYQTTHNQPGIAHILENLGSIWEDREYYDSAGVYFLGASKLNKRLNNQVELVSNLNNIGDVFRKTKQFDSALVYTLQALHLAQQLDLDYQTSSALRDLGKVYQDMGDYPRAMEYKEKSRELFEEIYSAESSRQLALMQTLYELQRKNAEIAALEAQRENDALKKMAAFGLTALLAVLTIVIVSRQRMKMRKNNQINEQQKQLYESQLENSKLEEERLKIELEHKQLQEEHFNLEFQMQQRSLAARMLQLIEKNKLLEEVKNGIQEVGKALSDKDQKKLNKLAKRIDSNFRHDKEWEEFRKSFEQVHKEFFDKLKQINPDLTSNDLRICALIKINLRSKEIAELLGISIDSLRVARYRLRKKLTLDRDQNLRQFILSV
ncbi:MAG: hypothetical protein CL843_11925 [Crocinitomicaceae bacterium]|nr:hypothetical protein [Crocinitomicaceae bacterium]